MLKHLCNNSLCKYKTIHLPPFLSALHLWQWVQFYQHGFYMDQWSDRLGSVLTSLDMSSHPAPLHRIPWLPVWLYRPHQVEHQYLPPITTTSRNCSCDMYVTGQTNWLRSGQYKKKYAVLLQISSSLFIFTMKLLLFLWHREHLLNTLESTVR